MRSIQARAKERASNRRQSRHARRLRSTGSLRSQFKRLARRWQEETALSSSTIEMAMHPAYQQIIGMGKPAVPLLLEALRQQPDHWFWALKAITSEDPVEAKDRGDLQRMSAAWLNWGARHGHLRGVDVTRARVP